MQLHQIQPFHKRKRQKPPVGRGGKRGTTSGHGTKGQKSRSGRRIRPAERDFIQRLPKLRGFKNKPLTDKPSIVKLADMLNRVAETTIDPAILLRARLIKNTSKPVKILGSGEVKKALTVKGISVSESARKAIEAAGGKIESRI